MGHDRRASTRLTAGWPGSYTLDDRPDHDLYHCRIIDLSLGGAALELFGPAPREDAGINVELQPTLLPAGLRLPAKARHLGPSTNTGVRLGVEWHGLTSGQSTALNLLLKLNYLRAS